jgi:hypothetical protein
VALQDGGGFLKQLNALRQQLFPMLITSAYVVYQSFSTYIHNNIYLLPPRTCNSRKKKITYQQNNSNFWLKKFTTVKRIL